MSDSETNRISDDELPADTVIVPPPVDDAELPPVTPPSAGFIFQLFLIPALIVLAIIAVMALFGNSAQDNQDWQTQVAELSHQNYHRRWRGANGLAEMLRADEYSGQQSQHLAQNPQIAAALSELLKEQLKKNSTREDDIKQAAFVARTLGLLDVQTTTFPVLKEAIQREHDREVRKNALASIAMTLGRAAERGETPSSPDLEADLIELASDEDTLIRQLTAFTLGLIPSEATLRQLEILQNDADPNTRINAAIALARNDSTAGLPLFKKVLSEALEPLPASPDVKAGDTIEAKKALQSAVEFEHNVVLLNVMKALEAIAGQLTEAERNEFRELLVPIENEYPAAQNRVEAKRIRNLLAKKVSAKS